MIDYNNFLILILVPAFVVGLQKYIENRASYRPPNSDELSKISRNFTGLIILFIRNIKIIRILLVVITIILSYIYVFNDYNKISWIALGGISIMIFPLSILVNWRIIFMK